MLYGAGHRGMQFCNTDTIIMRHVIKQSAQDASSAEPLRWTWTKPDKPGLWAVSHTLRHRPVGHASEKYDVHVVRDIERSYEKDGDVISVASGDSHIGRCRVGAAGESKADDGETATTRLEYASDIEE